MLFYPSLTVALDGVGGKRHTPAALIPGKRLVTRCTGDWVGPEFLATTGVLTCHEGTHGCGSIAPLILNTDTRRR